jgi:hypothetical protein
MRNHTRVFPRGFAAAWAPIVWTPILIYVAWASW